jgi:hypothetical protein
MAERFIHPGDTAGALGESRGELCREKGLRYGPDEGEDEVAGKGGRKGGR